MSAHSVLRHLHFRWQEIARHFWPETPHREAEMELARLDEKLERRQQRLLALRKRIEKLHQFLKKGEDRLALLTAQMDETPVDASAVKKLERCRSIVDRQRERLQEREHEYARQLARQRQRKQERLELRERFFTGRLPKPMDDESDPGYPF